MKEKISFFVLIILLFNLSVKGQKDEKLVLNSDTLLKYTNERLDSYSAVYDLNLVFVITALVDENFDVESRFIRIFDLAINKEIFYSKLPDNFIGDFIEESHCMIFYNNTIYIENETIYDKVKFIDLNNLELGIQKKRKWATRKMVDWYELYNGSMFMKPKTSNKDIGDEILELKSYKVIYKWPSIHYTKI